MSCAGKKTRFKSYGTYSTERLALEAKDKCAKAYPGTVFIIRLRKKGYKTRFSVSEVVRRTAK